MNEPGRRRPPARPPATARARTPPCVIVRGPLGIGKTTVSAELARRLGGVVVSIDAILERYDLERWRDGYISETSFRRANRYAAAAARRHLGAGTPVVIDGNFYWSSQVDGLVRALGGSPVVATLRAPLEVCLARDRGRARSFGEEAVRAVFAKATGVRRGVPVDATGSLASVLRSIGRQLPRGSLRRGSGGRRRPARPSSLI